MDESADASPRPVASPGWFNIPDTLLSLLKGQAAILKGQAAINRRLDRLLERIATVATQDDVNRITDAIDVATTGIRADIDQLKADVAAGNTLDFSGLDAKVAALSALDAENPGPAA